MPKSKRKRNTSGAKLDKHLIRYAAVCTIILGIIGIASFVAINLTIVDNPTQATLTGQTRIYANGKFYTPAEFEGATVSGTITFYFDVLTGTPSSVWFEVWTTTEETNTDNWKQNPIIKAQDYKHTTDLVRDTKTKTGYLIQSPMNPQGWQGSFDTTTIANGEYFFDVKADPGDGSIVTLSTFAFLKTNDGGEGLEPPGDEFEIPIEFILIVLGIIGFAVVVIVFVMYRWR